MSSYLKEIDTLPCTNDKLIIFGRAHYSYINQIFGDITVREILQEIMKKPGKLMVEESGPEFENSFHHAFKAGNNDSETICSAMSGYQDISVDINDTLCQSYSLMSYLNIPFDKTPSNVATVEQKHSKHLAMIAMYRSILENEEFVKKISEELIHKDNNKLWRDTINEAKPVYIIKAYKTGANIINVIKQVIDIWEKYGWMYFIGRGKCIQSKNASASRASRASRASKASRASSLSRPVTRSMARTTKAKSLSITRRTAH